MKLPDVKLELFEGPMDLLIHLIHKNEINIYDIPISLLADQFIDYIDKISEYQMDNISEFLVMASTLLEIKSKMLLPFNKQEEDEEDPREELLRKIIEYEQIKKAADDLSEKTNEVGSPMYKSQEYHLIKNWRKSKTSVAEDFLGEISIEMLQMLFLDVIKRKELKIDKVRSKFGEIDEDIYTVEEKMETLLTLLKANGNLEFQNAFRNDATKDEVVTTFCAVLELIKLQRINITQENNFANIYIEMKDS